jgi:hypothetical protein
LIVGAPISSDKGEGLGYFASNSGREPTRDCTAKFFDTHGLCYQGNPLSALRRMPLGHV